MSRQEINGTRLDAGSYEEKNHKYFLERPSICYDKFAGNKPVAGSGSCRCLTFCHQTRDADKRANGQVSDHCWRKNTENNVNALQFTCDSDPSRRWFILETGDAVQIKNVQTGKCLTIAGGRSTENNVNALQFTCDSDPSRRWRMKSVGGVFQIENVQTGKCLTIAGGRSTENNVDALQFTCDSDPSRTWRFQSGQPID